jgi:PKHD-type hydroxylase
MRTDVSFTIFLSDPSEYEGGELVIDSDIRPSPFKLPPGHAVIYPTHYLHRVNPVTKGVRQVVIGWIQSLIREPERRQVLLDLQQAMGQLQSTLPGGPNHPSFVRLHKIYINLQRMWSEV